jgi:hypothetical protein
MDSWYYNKNLVGFEALFLGDNYGGISIFDATHDQMLNRITLFPPKNNIPQPIAFLTIV